MLARAQRLALPGVVVLGAFLRLFYLQYGQYGSDDERLWAQALRSIASLSLPTSGIRSSIGANNGPFQVYLVMPAAALFSQAPLAGAIVVALLNAAAVYFLYRLIEEFFGRRPALIAALLFAVNSWAIIYARRMQGQDMLVPFQVLFFWSAARWLARGKGRDLVLMFLWLAVLTQVYILGLLHVVSAVVILALGWRHLLPPRKSQWLPLAGGAVLAVALAAPYAFNALFPAVSSFGNVSGSHPHVDAASVVLALTMASHKGFQTIAGQAGGVFDSTSGFEGWLVVAEEALFAAGFLYAVVRLIFRSPAAAGEGQGEGTWRKRDHPHVLALLLLWALIPVALFARHTVDLYPYYFVAIVPLPAVLTALLLDRLWTRGGVVVLGVLTANALALAGIFFYVLPGYWTKNDYGLPYRYTFEVVPQVEQLAAERHLARIYVDGDMDPSEVVSSVLSRAGLSVFWFDDYRTPEFAVPPAADPPALYVTMADDTDTARFLRQTFASRQVLAFPLPGEGVTIRGYQLAPADVRQALGQLLTEKLNLKAANGIALNSFHGDRRLQLGNTLQAALSWTWPGGVRPDKLRYALFAHLVDGRGNVVAETDNPLLPSVDWRAGEQVVQWLDLPVPTNIVPGRYVLDVGIYGQDGVVRQELTDASGKSIGGSLTLGPFVVPPPPPDPSASPVEAQLGDGIQLLAHGVTTSPGQLHVDLTWAASAQPSKDYTVFVHVLDASGKVVAQADSQPRGGDFPTSVWQAGDRIDDSYALQAPPGRYTVEAGMYDLPTLQRLGDPVRFEVQVS
ncbi:MAG: ArnT family glycosyltransferase [Chloroflexota bacterium]